MFVVVDYKKHELSVIVCIVQCTVSDDRIAVYSCDWLLECPAQFPTCLGPLEFHQQTQYVLELSEISCAFFFVCFCFPYSQRGQLAFCQELLGQYRNVVPMTEKIDDVR